MPTSDILAGIVTESFFLAYFIKQSLAITKNIYIYITCIPTFIFLLGANS